MDKIKEKGKGISNAETSQSEFSKFDFFVYKITHG